MDDEINLIASATMGARGKSPDGQVRILQKRRNVLLGLDKVEIEKGRKNAEKYLSAMPAEPPKPNKKKKS